MNLRFEWDKAKANHAKHGVSFELAKSVFKDPFAVELLDDRRDCGGETYLIIGMVDEVILHVVYTEREQILRIISARRATKYEQEIYFEQEA